MWEVRARGSTTGGKGAFLLRAASMAGVTLPDFWEGVTPCARPWESGPVGAGWIIAYRRWLSASNPMMGPSLLVLAWIEHALQLYLHPALGA